MAALNQGLLPNKPVTGFPENFQGLGNPSSIPKRPVENRNRVTKFFKLFISAKSASVSSLAPSELNRVGALTAAQKKKVPEEYREFKRVNQLTAEEIKAGQLPETPTERSKFTRSNALTKEPIEVGVPVDHPQTAIPSSTRGDQLSADNLALLNAIFGIDADPQPPLVPSAQESEHSRAAVPSPSVPAQSEASIAKTTTAGPSNELPSQKSAPHEMFVDSVATSSTENTAAKRPSSPVVTPDHVHEVMANGSTNEFRQFGNTLISSSIDPNRAFDLLSAKNQHGVPGFLMAMRNGDKQIVEAFIKVIDHLPFNEQQKLELLMSCDTFDSKPEANGTSRQSNKLRAPALRYALEGKPAEEINYFPAVNAYCSSIFSTKSLTTESKIQLLEAKDCNGTPALHLGMQCNNQQAVIAFFAQVLNSDQLAPEQKLELLLGRRADGTPALHMAIGKPSTAWLALKCCKMVANSDQLTAAQKTEFLSAKDNKGRSPLQLAYSRKCFATFTRFANGIDLTEDLSKEQRIQILSLSSENPAALNIKASAEGTKVVRPSQEAQAPQVVNPIIGPMDYQNLKNIRPGDLTQEQLALYFTQHGYDPSVHGELPLESVIVLSELSEEEIKEYFSPADYYPNENSPVQENSVHGLRKLEVTECSSDDDMDFPELETCSESDDEIGGYATEIEDLQSDDEYSSETHDEMSKSLPANSRNVLEEISPTPETNRS